mgnify:CR=1 FL=1
MKKYLFLLFTLALTSCNQTSGKIKVATTFAPLFDYTKRIVQDKMDVIDIVNTNELHSFSMSSQKDTIFVEQSSLVVAYGQNLDDFVKDINPSKYFNCTENVNFIVNNNVVDPHSWLSFKESQTMLTNIYNEIIKIDANNKDFYSSNYSKAIKEFQELDSKYTNFFNNTKNAKIVTSHEAFNYWARDYKVQVKGIADLLNNEPSISRLNEVKNYIKDNNVHTIFVEETSNLGYVKTLIDNLKSEGYTNINYTVLSAYESADYKDWNNQNYVKIMEENLEILQKSL